MSEESVTIAAAFLTSFISGLLLFRAGHIDCQPNCRRPLILFKWAGSLIILGTLFTGAYTLSGEFGSEALLLSGLAAIGFILAYAGVATLTLQFIRLNRRVLELESVRITLENRQK